MEHLELAAIGGSRLFSIALAAMTLSCASVQEPRRTSPSSEDWRSELAKRFDVPTLARMRALSVSQRGDAVYERLYLSEDDSKGPVPSQDEWNAPPAPNANVRVIGSWKVWWGEAGQEGDDCVRLYLNLQPTFAARAATELVGLLDERKTRFTLKMPAQVDRLKLENAAVLYVERAQYPVARALLLAWADSHPETFASATLPFTRRLAAGISTADEPDPARTPRTRPQHSFGTFMSDVVAEAIAIEADPNALPRSVERRLRAYGVDPSRPWLRQGKDVDDL